MRINKSPFCWQNKYILRQIREAFDATNDVASAIGTYVALTEIASDAQKDCFQTTQAWIGQRAGLSPRTVGERLKVLCEIGVIKMVVPAIRGPATFTLLDAVAQPLPNDAQQLPSDQQPMQSDTQPVQIVLQRDQNASLHPLEESLEQSPEKSREDGRMRSSPAPISFEDLIKELKTNPAYEGIDVEREYHKMVPWCAVHKKQVTRRRFINWLNRVERPMNTQSQSRPSQSSNLPILGVEEPIRPRTAEEQRRVVEMINKGRIARGAEPFPLPSDDSDDEPAEEAA